MYFRFGGHIAISVAFEITVLRSPWSILQGSQLKSNKFDVSLSKRLGSFLPQAQQVCLKIEAH